MTPETEAKINEYLADETKLYQDWYLGLCNTEDSQYTQEVGVLPTLSELEKMCENWIKQQAPFIKKNFCPPYCQKLQQYQNQEVWLIAMVADILTVTFAGVPVNFVAVAVILVTKKHLDKLCDC